MEKIEEYKKALYELQFVLMQLIHMLEGANHGRGFEYRTGAFSCVTNNIILKNIIEVPA